MSRLHANGLSIALFLLFLGSLTGQALTGFRYHNQTQEDHGEPPLSLTEYLHSGDFVEAVFENWESEFLQMGVFVVLTVWLRQKGASESKKLEGGEEVDEEPEKHANDPDTPWPVRQGGWVLAVYRRSLSLALFALFLVSFVCHAAGGTRSDCEERQAHHRACLTLPEYMVSARFWFQSFQNWQSEFLSIGVLVVLSIWLRQHGSPQSKPVHSPHAQTGSAE